MLTMSYIQIMRTVDHKTLSRCISKFEHRVTQKEEMKSVDSTI